MTHEEILLKIVFLAADIWGIAAENIYSPSKQAEYIDARTSIYFALVELRKNFSYSEIAKYMNKHPSTISHLVNKVYAIERIRHGMRTLRQDTLLKKSTELLKRLKQIAG